MPPPLIEAMQKANTDVMPMSLPEGFKEKTWSKRDAFILMDCDSEEYANTPIRESGWIFLKKSPDTVALIDEWLYYIQDPRIVTDMPNQLGKENYEGFRENRHDQTVWSLLTKKHGIKPFREPCQYFPPTSGGFSKDILDRSTYPVTFCLHRRNLRREQFVPLVPQLISVAARIEAEKLPQFFKDDLAHLVEWYVQKAERKELPADLPPAQDILADYHKLNFPETPFVKDALSKMPITLNRA